MLGPLTYLDAALVAVAILSGLLAMYRGFTREVLSILSWVAALGALLYFVLYHKPAAEHLAKQFSVPIPVAQIVMGAIIFLIVLIVVHLLTARISDSIQDSGVGMVDRVLGFIFGAVRGFVLIVIPYMFYEAFFPDPTNQFEWVRSARSLPYIKSAGHTFRNILVKVVPSSLTEPKGEQQGLLPASKVRVTIVLDEAPHGLGARRKFVIYRGTTALAGPDGWPVM
ncbi:MAG: CvpA family protein [Hyphomicrobiaceae bacterium]